MSISVAELKLAFLKLSPEFRIPIDIEYPEEYREYFETYNSQLVPNINTLAYMTKDPMTWIKSHNDEAINVGDPNKIPDNEIANTIAFMYLSFIYKAYFDYDPLMDVNDAREFAQGIWDNMN